VIGDDNLDIQAAGAVPPEVDILGAGDVIRYLDVDRRFSRSWAPRLVPPLRLTTTG
jgi:hypothetical protein